VKVAPRHVAVRDEVGQRHFEQRRDLARIGPGFERGIHPGHDRRDPESGDGQHRIQIAQRLDRGRRQADFLPCLARRRAERAVVGGFEAAAGETHLPGVVAQVVGAQGQQHARRFVAQHDADQHRGRHRRQVGGQDVAQFVEVARLARRRRRQRMQRAAQVGEHGRMHERIHARAPLRLAREGSTSRIRRKRSASPNSRQRTISSRVRWHPRQTWSRSSVQLRMQGELMVRASIRA
jgi:hypothetical protein